MDGNTHNQGQHGNYRSAAPALQIKPCILCLKVADFAVSFYPAFYLHSLPRHSHNRRYKGCVPSSLLGTWSAKGVLIAATGVLNPDLFMVNSVSELNLAISAAGTVKLPMLFAGIAVTLLFALLAAFPAAWYASRVSPVVAMSGVIEIFKML